MRTGSDDVQRLYRRLAPAYDLVYGLALEPGRRRAMSRLAPVSGESVLEVGVGTGLSAMSYPRTCRVVGIDISQEMLARAERRMSRGRLHHVALCRMDAACLGFPDESFDAVYAAYVMNVVPDPVQVARELHRVCRRGGRVVLLNHFCEARREDSWPSRMLGRMAKEAGGANWDLDLQGLLDQAELRPISIDRVNVPRVSSVVVCARA